MDMIRRSFIIGGAAAMAAGPVIAASGKATGMYGLIGKMTAQPGKRDALIAILVEGVAGMPGCLSYVVAADPSNAETIWITEVWKDKAAHSASLSLPSVRDAITKGRPLIAGMEMVAETAPVGGSGFQSAK